MQWVPASMRLPEVRGFYFVREILTGNRSCTFYKPFSKSKIYAQMSKYEWLDESSSEIDTEQLWDEFSEHIDDDIDSFSVVAGSSVITRPSFKKMMQKIQSPTADAGKKE